MRNSATFLAAMLVLSLLLGAQQTTVPGQTSEKWDADQNGYPDVGITVVGKYNALYAYDANGDYYLDYGDGRIAGTVDSPSQLNQATLTSCIYQVHYRGGFKNDPYQDDGWIMNNINCTGYEKGSFSYLIVHKTDPRYTGNPDWAEWGEWEYHIQTASGSGNLVRRLRPFKHVG